MTSTGINDNNTQSFAANLNQNYDANVNATQSFFQNQTGQVNGQQVQNSGQQIQMPGQEVAIPGQQVAMQQFVYDQTFLPNLRTVNPAEESELKYIEDIRKNIKATINKKYKKVIGSLEKPDTPFSADNTRYSINSMIVDKIWAQIARNKLDGFYTQKSLQSLVERACMHDYRLFQLDFGIQNIDIATDISLLSMYDIILIGDDSGSMSTTDKGSDCSRWDLLKILVKTISFWGTLMDDDGIDVRMFNFNIGSDGNNIRTKEDVEHLFSLCKPSGVTPMGASIKKTMLEKKIAKKIKKDKLKKPVLFLIITDGVPSSKEEVVEAITSARKLCKDSKYGRRAIAFGFCQIGKDKEASKWLNKLDSDSSIGNSVDCTSDYSVEEKEFRKSGNKLTPGSYIAKLLIGPINSVYDKADEGANMEQIEKTEEYYSQNYSPFYAPSYYTLPNYFDPNSGCVQL